MSRFHALLQWCSLWALQIWQASCLVRGTETSTRRVVIEGLLSGEDAQGQIYAILKSEKVHPLQTNAHRHLHISLANLSLPVPPEVRDLARKADGAGKITPTEADQAAKKLNKMLEEQQIVLDHKVIDCREKCHRFGEAMLDVAEDVRSLASQTSDARGILVDATARLPQDRRSFNNFKLEAELSRKRCEGAGLSYKVKANSMANDAMVVAQLRDAVHRQCGNQVFLQLPTKATRTGDVEAHQQRSSGIVGCKDVAAALGVVARKRGGLVAAFVQELQSPQCTLNHQNCAAMLDVIDEVSGEIADSQARLKASAARDRQSCKDDDDFAKGQLTMEASQATDRTRELNEATTKAGVVGYMVNRKDSERQKLQAQLKAVTAKCHTDISDIIYGKMCALQKARDSLQLLAGRTELPEDCQVSDWDKGICSATCGGGMKKLTREVVLSQNGGAACPPLSMSVRCGETPCPKDCVVSPFSVWTPCSAQCDGGVQQRARVVLAHPLGNGVACPHLVDMRTCNTQKCTSTCDLLQWIPWTPCNRACSGGTQMRTRGLQDEGRTSCPKWDSPQRLETRSCNQKDCAKVQGEKCSGAPLDIVLLLDISGSMTKAGVDTLRSLTLELIKFYAPAQKGTQLSIASFAKQPTAISGLSTDPKHLSNRLWSRLSWRKEPGNGGAAISRASSLLCAGGRKAASKMVLMISDGRVVDPFFAKQASERLKKSGARMVFAIVGEGYKHGQLLKSLASMPGRDNVIQLPGLTKLSKQLKSSAKRIVASTCSDLA